METIALKEKTTLLIGASENPSRMSNMVTQEMRSRGIPVLAVGARTGQIGDVEIHKNPEDFEGAEVHTVGMYINPSLQPQYYDFILGLKPKRIFFNPGTENPELMRLARAQGIQAMDACMMVALTLSNY